MGKRKKWRARKSALFQTEPDILKDPKILKNDEEFRFECTRCGECCRNVEQSVLLESLDIFRIASYLKKIGRGISGVEDVILQYTELKTLGDVELPIFFLKTRNQKKECVFLLNGRCSVHAAKPRACRSYPLSAWSKDATIYSGHTGTDDFEYTVVSAKQHHFTGPLVRTKDWMDATFSEADREFVLHDVRAALEQAFIVRRLQRAGVDQERILKQLLLFRYVFYELDEPFLPQFKRNMAMLKQTLLSLSR